jgi:hypothetical protein
MWMPFSYFEGCLRVLVLGLGSGTDGASRGTGQVSCFHCRHAWHGIISYCGLHFLWQRGCLFSFLLLSLTICSLLFTLLAIHNFRLAF